MSYKNFMNKVRYLDSLASKWMMRHFYFMFFQTVLAAIFIFWFINTIKIVDVSFQVSENTILERLMMNQSVNTSIIVLLIILNSFWLLYIFNTIQRQTNILRDISYHISRYRNKNK